jgi:hypothetical protein
MGLVKVQVPVEVLFMKPPVYRWSKLYRASSEANKQFIVLGMAVNLKLFCLSKTK